MSAWVLAVGILVTAMSGFLLLRREQMAPLIDRVFGSRWIYGAALMRLLLGALLIAAAPDANYPRAVALFGWIFALGGLLLVVVPAPVVHRLANRFVDSLSPAAARLWLGAAVVFGLFLVAAGLP